MPPEEIAPEEIAPEGRPRLHGSFHVTQDIPPIGFLRQRPDEDPLVESTLDVARLVEDVSLAPSLLLFGRLESPRVRALYEHSSSREVGWEVEWNFQKSSVLGGAFDGSVVVYVPAGVRRSRVLELILEKFLFFAQHEVREAFTFRGTRPFDPHVPRASSP